MSFSVLKCDFLTETAFIGFLNETFNNKSNNQTEIDQLLFFFCQTSINFIGKKKLIFKQDRRLLNENAQLFLPFKSASNHRKRPFVRTMCVFHQFQVNIFSLNDQQSIIELNGSKVSIHFRLKFSVSILKAHSKVSLNDI